MKKIAVLMMGAAVALSSCTKDNSAYEGNGSKTISFLTDEIRTRVTGTNFDDADAITVQAYKDGAAYKSANYTYAGNGSEFTSTTPITYQSDDAVALAYEAVYPAVDTYASAFTNTIATDQTDAAAVEASDLLVAKVAATTELKPELNFVHTMSLVNLTVVVNRDGVASTEAKDAVTDLKINAAVEAACDVTAGTYAASGSVVEITPAGSDLSYKVLVAPQDIAADNFAAATIGEQSFTMENTAATLASGYVYDLTWTIDLTTGTQTVEITGVIDEWNKGEWGDGSTTTTPDQGGDQDDDQSVTMTFDGTTFDSEDAFASVVVDNATFDVSDVYSHQGNFATAGGSYLYNRTELVGLSEVVVDYASASELTVYAGTEANPTTGAITGVENADGDMVYTIPADSKFIRIENNVGTYINATSVVLTYTSLGDTVEPTIVAPITLTCDAIMIAMGATSVPGGTGLEVKDAVFENFTITSDKGTGSTPFRLWTDDTIRSYAGNTVTITAADGKTLTGVEFSHSAITAATVGTVDGKTWTGEATEVTLTMDKDDNDNITVSYK